jgi:hypothetical protein
MGAGAEIKGEADAPMHQARVAQLANIALPASAIWSEGRMEPGRLNVS